MKAIDFACRLLVSLTEDTLPLPTQQVLLAVAAGLQTGADIARFMGITPSVCAGILRSLAHRNLIQRVNGLHAVYELAPAGRDQVRRYFSFLPHSRT